jgi:hypothetical protein
MRLAFNPVLNQISIGDYSGLKVIDIDPHTGGLINTHSYSGYGALTDIKFDQSGQPIVLTGAIGNFGGHLHHGGEHNVLVAVPAQFDYCPVVSKAAVALSGPDWVSVFDWSGAGRAEAVNVPVTSPLKLSVASVNAREAAIHCSQSGTTTAVLSIYDNLGRRVRSFHLPHAGSPALHSLTWDLRDGAGSRVSAGTYFCRLQAGPAVAIARLVVTP